MTGAVRQAAPGSPHWEPRPHGIDQCLRVPRLLGCHPGEVHSPKNFARGGCLPSHPSYQLAFRSLGAVGVSAGERPPILALTNPGKLTLEPARSLGSAPEQVEGSIENRPIIPPSNEDGPACNSHPISCVETDEGEGTKKRGSLTRIHVQAGTPQHPPELHDVCCQLFTGSILRRARPLLGIPEPGGHVMVGSKFAGKMPHHETL
jgi:hypothetical protein